MNRGDHGLEPRKTQHCVKEYSTKAYFPQNMLDVGFGLLHNDGVLQKWQSEHGYGVSKTSSYSGLTSVTTSWMTLHYPKGAWLKQIYLNIDWKDPRQLEADSR